MSCLYDSLPIFERQAFFYKPLSRIFLWVYGANRVIWLLSNSIVLRRFHCQDKGILQNEGVSANSLQKGWK